MTISAYSITTVVTPAGSADLVDLDTWKDDWKIAGTDDDAFLGRTISRCSAEAAQYCNRIFGYALYQDIVRLERGNRLGHIVSGGRDPIQLGRWPLVSVTSVTEQGATAVVLLTQDVDFEVYAEAAQLFRLDHCRNPRVWPTVKITAIYSAGWLLPSQDAIEGVPELPLDITDAVGRMVYSRYAQRDQDPFIAEEMVVGVGSVKYIPGTGTAANMSPDVADILDNYRVPVIA